VLEEILSGRIKPGVGGERRHLCVLFSDIRSFTTRSETQPPEMIIKLLNDYFEEMTASVHRYGGTIDKFIGDGLMAFFGAPSPRENAVQDAFDAARDMLQRLVVLNERLQAESIEPIRIGVGLDAGEVVVGHVGSKQRHEYTVIGDTVNTASRLEGLTKELGYPVIVSAGAVDMLDNKDRLVDLGKQAVKGRAPVPVFGWSPPVKPA
jgi:class 3 adenylate cyclase